MITKDKERLGGITAYVLEILGGITAGILLVPYMMIINGWAIAKLWGWFMVPIFGLPVLTIPMALGVGTVVVYLTHRIDWAEAKTDSGKGIGHVLVKGFAIATFKPLISVLFGYIIKCWM